MRAPLRQYELSQLASLCIFPHVPSFNSLNEVPPTHLPNTHLSTTHLSSNPPTYSNTPLFNSEAEQGPRLWQGEAHLGTEENTQRGEKRSLFL